MRGNIKYCHTIREDGAYVEAGENDNLIVQKLGANQNAVGIFGYSFLEQNADKVAAIAIDDVVPAFDTIESSRYPISRLLYFYVKKGHVGSVPGIEGFIQEFTSEKAWGEEGYLSEKGLIPMQASERKDVAEEAKRLKAFSM